MYLTSFSYERQLLQLRQLLDYLRASAGFPQNRNPAEWVEGLPE
jgi:hypothetical protein